jgi:aspartyl-tRNA(Asn)/glutamyl-tRNA(Gln) amidotransferase subunit C
MAELSKDQVRHLAHLARVSLSKDEEDTFSSTLTNILTFIEKINEVNTDDVQEFEQVTGLTSIARNDYVSDSDASPDDLLTSSPLPLTEHQIQTPSAYS